MSASMDENLTNRAVSLKRNLFEYLFVKFNTVYERCFSKLGTQIGTRPYFFIILSFLLTGFCSLGFLRINVMSDVDLLFIPTDSQSVKDQKFISNLLPINYDEYFLHQDYDLGRFAEVIFVASDYGNIARPLVRKELTRIFALMQKINVTYQNQTYFYPDVCAKRGGECVTEGDIFFRESFWQRLHDKQLHQYLLTNFYTDDDGVPNSLTFIFGKHMNLDMTMGTLSSKVFKLRFNLRRTNTAKGADDHSELLSQMWEQACLDFFKHFHSVVVKPIYAVSTSIERELENNINLDIKLVFGTFALMIVVATICLSLRAPFSQSPVHLSGVGVLATALGLVSGFGFCLLIGIPICSLVFVTPFLIIGVGTDDMFLIYSAYRRTKSGDNTAHRLSETFRLCGSGITITSLTNVIAFLAGATTNFYGIRLFCYYTSASIAFCYIYQITLFSSSVAIYNDCINNNRHTLTLRLLDRASSGSDRRPRRQQCVRWKEMFVCLIKPLFTTTGQIIVCLIFVIYTMFAVYGALQMTDGMKFSQLLSDTSYAKDYFDTLEREFQLHPLVQFVITEPIPYWRTDYLRRIEELIRNAQQIEGMDTELVISWLSMIGYNSYDYPFDNGTKFLEIAHGFINLFPTFYNDMQFNETHILASRFYLKTARACHNSSDGYLVHQLRSLVEQSKLPITVFASLFKYYEQMYEVIPNIIQTFLIAIEAMYLVTLLIIPDLKSVLITISTMCMILVSLVAALHTWGIQASSVVMVEMVMAIGFCSDFCVHIIHAFLTGRGTRRERAQQALIDMGMPILCASLSSICGVMFLGFAHSYLFRTFFKTILALMIIGTLHALCFLPVILSLVGSHWPSHMADAIPPNDSLQMISSTKSNSTSRSNGHSNEDNTSKRNGLQHAPDTIDEEEDDELISTTKKSDTLKSNTPNMNMFV